MSDESFPFHSGHLLLAMARTVGAKNVADSYSSTSRSAQSQALVSCRESAAITKEDCAIIHKDLSCFISVQSFTLVFHHGSAATNDLHMKREAQALLVPGSLASPGLLKMSCQVRCLCVTLKFPWVCPLWSTLQISLSQYLCCCL